MIKCDTCQQKKYFCSKTEDQKNICRTCYDEIFKLTFKGILDTKTIIKAKERQKNYKTLKTTLFKLIRKHNILNKENTIQIKDIIRKEDELSIQIFKKYRNCLYMSEHEAIINTLIQNLNLNQYKDVHLNELNGNNVLSFRFMYDIQELYINDI